MTLPSVVKIIPFSVENGDHLADFSLSFASGSENNVVS